MKLAIAGAAGRMGRVLTRIINQTPGAEVAGGLEPKGSPHVGGDMGELAGVGRLDVAITDDPIALLTHVDGIIDFTVPQAQFLGLTVPDAQLHQDEDGHYQTGPLDWSEFNAVLKGNGPCNAERIAERREAHAAGAWVREAAIAHAAKRAARAVA